MRLFISLLFISVVFSYQVFADNGCSSIVDKKCDWEKYLIIANDVEVKITVPEKQIIDYSIRKTLTNTASDCPQGKCICEEIVGSVELIGKADGLELINEQEKNRSEDYRCNITKVYGRHRPQFVYATPQIVSIVSYNLNYIRDVTESCHGEHPFITYDALFAGRYLLKDIIAGNISALSDALVDDFIVRYAKQDSGDVENIRQSVQKYIKENPPENSGFVVENGKIYVNIGAFIFGCSSGSFYPVEVPEKFINKEFLSKIKK